MSDFLRNLRSTQKKDPTHQRKPLDGHYFPQNDRRLIKDRRTTYSPQDMNRLPEKLGEMLPEILEHVANLTEQVEKQTSINEDIAESAIRRNNAIADFFEIANQLMSNDLIPSAANMAHRPMATTSYASGTHYTKDDILDMIQSMRNQGSTFAIIADYLKEKGIPTFSGRGEWHAQTIHRLCK